MRMKSPWKTLIFPALLMLCLQGCSSLGEEQVIPTGATWTPETYSTDQPFQVSTEAVSYFGNTPVLLFFGSIEPGNASPLRVINISTDDVYDVSAIPPAPVSEWSRPITAENKDVFFQVGDTLYVFSPGGAISSVVLPYDELDPAYCNWSWKGKLVCLNTAMSTGFMVNQDLTVEALHLPANTGVGTEWFYEPYRVGKNTIRSVQTTTVIEDGKPVVIVKDLNLETQKIETKTIYLELDFETYYGALDKAGKFTILKRLNETIGVLGVSHDLEAIYLYSAFQLISDDGDQVVYQTEDYDVANAITRMMGWNVDEINDKNRFYHNYLITAFDKDENSQTQSWPSIYDLDMGVLYFDTYQLDTLDDGINFILPYGDNWIVGYSSGLQYVWGKGNVIWTYTFPEKVTASMGSDSFYTITQPMEP